MNETLFEKCTNRLIEILNKSSIDEKEKIFRKNKLLKIYDTMKKENKIYNEYYSLSHEIRSLEFLENIGTIKIANDRKSRESGCDFILDNNYQIECVCSSTGDEKRNGFYEYSLANTLNKGIVDYNKKETIILTRLSSSIKDKLTFYNNHIEYKTISDKKPYIIFLGLGNLSCETFTGEFGFVLNKILFGVGHERLYFDEKINKFTKSDYTHNTNILKYNEKEIDCNIFLDNSYKNVSAIIFSTADLNENYNKSNTFLFIHPFALNTIQANKFNNIIYWKKNKKDEYIPRYRGKNLSYKFKKRYF